MQPTGSSNCRRAADRGVCIDLPEDVKNLLDDISNEIDTSDYTEKIDQLEELKGSFQNTLDETEADVDEVANAIGTDSRIGPKFLKSSVGNHPHCISISMLMPIMVYLRSPLVIEYHTI